MTKRYFVTATDTDAGKTLITSALCFELAKKMRVSAFKPISAGCDLIDGELINEDAKCLFETANMGQTISEVNPIAYQAPIAPHIAAANQNEEITLADIESHYQNLNDKAPDIIFTEGAGGWRLPIGNGKFLSDFAISTNQQVILVVNMKLGCLNHALLTYETIKRDGLECVAWVANSYQDMLNLKENFEELKALLPVPCLGFVPKVSSYEQAGEYLNTAIL